MVTTIDEQKAAVRHTSVDAHGFIATCRSADRARNRRACNGAETQDREIHPRPTSDVARLAERDHRRREQTDVGTRRKPELATVSGGRRYEDGRRTIPVEDSDDD